MKIKVAFLETDKSYIDRLISSFGVKYSDKLELYYFSSLEAALKNLESSKIDVFIAHDSFDINTKDLPQRCGFAYLVDSPDIESVRNVPSICKFQKAELIYKQILSIFSENATEITGIKFNSTDGSQVIGFTSPAGGTGCSTAAAAFAVSRSKQCRVLYLNIEKFGDSNLFFEAPGFGDFSDIIYAVKSKKSNISMKLESVVKQDSTGVFFYSPTKIALDMTELTTTDIKNLLSDIKLFGGYDYIVLDIDFSLDKGTLEIFKECNTIVLVSDGSDICNCKMNRALKALEIIDQQSDMKLLLRCGVLYNRFSSLGSNKLDNFDIQEFGGIKRYEGYNTHLLLKQISELGVFDNIQ